MNKYERIHDDLKDSIYNLSLRVGEALPTEVELMKQYSVSRPTVAKALKMLESQGLVVRRPGLGTFVREVVREPRQLLFGLAFPETVHGEIFDPIMTRIASFRTTHNFSLLWGSPNNPSKEFSVKDLYHLFDDFIERGVNGVFFAPLEGGPGASEANRTVIERLTRTGSRIVLVDRDMVLFPSRSEHPLVMLDNVRASYILTCHYLEQGVDRVDYVGLPYDSYAGDLRIRGYRLALFDYGITPQSEWIHFGDPDRSDFVQDVIGGGSKNVICLNDETAALFLNTLRELSVAVPQDVRVSGFDDVKYSRLISVPLTTVQQPVAAIAEKAIEVMMESVSHTHDAPSEAVVLSGELVVRESSMVQRR